MPDTVIPGAALEAERDPVAELPRRQRETRAPRIYVRRSARSIEIDPKRHPQRPAFGVERILRTLDRRLDSIARQGDGNTRAALLESLASRARREQQEGALCTEQIGHRHRAQLRAVEAIGRERDGHAQDRAPDVVLAEHHPERLRLAEQPQLRPFERDAIPSDPEEARDAPEVRAGELRKVRAAVAIDEVEDVVPSRLRPRAERRPRHRRDRRERGLQTTVRSPSPRAS